MLLLETGQQTSADATGAFSLTGVPLAIGANTFTVRATDVAGNQRSAIQTITRTATQVNNAPTDIIFSVEPPPSGTTPPVIVAHLAAVDADAGDSATFSIAAQSVLSGAADTFTINGNALVDGINPHGASIDSYDITVRATDTHGATYDEHVVLTFGTNTTSPGDAITGATGNDIIYALGNGSAFGQHDIIHAGSGDDVVFGQDGRDDLFGEDGNDVLNGGAGGDSLTGGAGSDIFQFSAVADSTISAPDFIRDFTHGVDLIDVSAIHGVGDVPLTFDAVANADVVPNHITWLEVGASTIIQIDVNGDPFADMHIVLTGTGLSLDAQDFKV